MESILIFIPLFFAIIATGDVLGAGYGRKATQPSRGKIAPNVNKAQIIGGVPNNRRPKQTNNDLPPPLYYYDSTDLPPPIYDYTDLPPPIPDTTTELPPPILIDTTTIATPGITTTTGQRGTYPPGFDTNNCNTQPIGWGYCPAGTSGVNNNNLGATATSLMSPRWYFDAGRGDCVAVAQDCACIKSRNNYASYSSCISACYYLSNYYLHPLLVNTPPPPTIPQFLPKPMTTPSSTRNNNNFGQFQPFGSGFPFNFLVQPPAYSPYYQNAGTNLNNNNPNGYLLYGLKSSTNNQLQNSGKTFIKKN